MWYRYENKLFNLNNYSLIFKNIEMKDRIQLNLGKLNCNDYDLIIYGSVKERDAEFEKISKMLGLEEKEHISRCC